MEKIQPTTQLNWLINYISKKFKCFFENTSSKLALLNHFIYKLKYDHTNIILQIFGIKLIKWTTTSTFQLLIPPNFYNSVGNA